LARDFGNYATGKLQKTSVAKSCVGRVVALKISGQRKHRRHEAQAVIRLIHETRVISTDEHKGYDGLDDDNTIHVTVDHSKKQYVRGLAHTNTLENVWSLFKRSIVGSYHQISVKHLDRYLDEFEFRFNNRHNPFLFRDTLLRLLAASNLEYKELTKERVA